MGCVIQAESHTVELPHLYEWEHDPNTHEFWDQPSPVKLRYRTAGGKRACHYSTPDYFLLQEDWAGWIECKPEAKLVESLKSGSDRYIQDGGDWRCPAGEAYAAQYGLGFKVLSSKGTNRIRVRNLIFLSDYLRPDCPIPSETDLEAVTASFASERWVTLQQLLTSGGNQADTVFALIAFGKLFVDLDTELLSEPGFTHVCADALSLEVYRSRKVGAGRSAASLRTIRLTPGARIVWDGSPWRILNVGDSDIVLEDQNHAISTLRYEIFQTLTGQGAIIGEPGKTDSKYAAADALIKRATPTDLAAAVNRAERLDARRPAEPTASLPLPVVPARTLRYWRKRASEGENACGNSFVGLIPRISQRGNRYRKVSSAVVEEMNAIIVKEVLTVTDPQVSLSYGMLRNICRVKGLCPPSEKTFRAEIKRRREAERILARQGAKAAYAITEFCWLVDQSTPRHGERPFEIGHIDHTQLDIEMADSRTGANLGKPWLTLFLDAFTRVVLAFYLTYDPPSYRSCMAVIRQAFRRYGRIPNTIVVDRGSDFECVNFNILLARLESHKKSRPAAKSRFGTVIERYFGMTNEALIHNLAGNNKALQNPRSMSSSHDPRGHSVWTLPAFNDLFEQFVDEAYANLPHPALGQSPKEAMDQGLLMTGNRGHLLIPYTEELDLLCMPTTKAGKSVVRPGRGIKIKGIHYFNPVFRDGKVERTKVPVRYDPFDVSRAYACVAGQWVLCRSEHQAQLERRSEREIALISQEVRALRSLAESRRPLRAERLAAFIESARTTEAVLRQQRRDAERISDGTSPAVPQSDATLLPHMKIDHKELWSGHVNFEHFEELQ